MKQGMRAVLPGPYTVIYEEFEVPAPGPGHVLIETEASAISAGTELAVYTGIHQWLADPQRAWPKFPFVPGYSAVGHIRAVGHGVEQFTVGQRVIWPGRHESHAVVAADGDAPIWPIADHVPGSVAACAVLARFPLTALVRAQQILGQAVVVLGLGLIGQITLRLFSATGAYPVVGIDPEGARRMMAMRARGVETVDPAGGELRELLRARNWGALPDIVVDATGVGDAVRTAMHIVADGGQVIMVGSPRSIAGDVDFYWDLHGRSISLTGAHGSAIGTEPREKFPFVRERALRLLVHLLESGKLPLEDLITHQVHGSDLQAMYEGLRQHRDQFLGVTVHW